MQRNALLFLLTCLIGHDCFSQQYPFVHYTPKDGLVNNRTNFLFQDSKGQLYISTFGGLSVYDGSRFTNYTTDDGLSVNIVNDIVEMGDDSIWVIPNNSKIHYLRKGKIHDLITSDGFCPVINKMIRCKDGSWYALADEGLFQFAKNHFTKIELVDGINKNAGCFLINAAESNKKLIMVTDANLQAITGSARLIVFDLKKQRASFSQLPRNYFVLASPQGDILVATEFGIRKLDVNALLRDQIRYIPLPDIYRQAAPFVANYMYFDRSQNLWLCTERGVARIDTKSQLTFFSAENGLISNHQVSLFEDRENSMWFADGQTGVSKLATTSVEFYEHLKPGFFTTDLYADERSDSAWFLDSYHNRILLAYKNDIKEFLLDDDIRCPPYRFITAFGNNVYLSDRLNVYKCNFSPGNRIRPTLLRADTSTNTDKGLNCMLTDDRGNLVVASEDITVIRKNKEPLIYPLGYFSDKFVINSFDHLWAVTREKKLFSFGLHPDSPGHYLQLQRLYNKDLPSLSPRSITADKEGNVWIGGRNDGLVCLSFDKSQSIHSSFHFTTKDGMSDNFITYLHTDPENNIWACSPAGLDKIQHRNGKFYIENVTGSNNIYQYVVKIQSSRSGVHWVQTGEGVIKINPARVRSTTYRPQIFFREILEGRNTLPIQSAVRALSYKENNLHFFLAAPSFIDEKQVRFSYLLKGGRDKSWSDPSIQSVINLANLEPGKYELCAKASFVNGIYPVTETAFSFVIKPPWWQAPLFQLAVTFLAAIFLWVIIRNFYKRKLKEQRIALERQQAIEKERTRIATDMHDDLGAGLSTIRFLSERVKRNTFSQVTRQDIDKMQGTSNELIGRMNEIIWSLSETNDTLEDLLFYIRSYSMEYCEDNNLHCNIVLPEKVPPVFVSAEVRRNIFLTVKESLHNIAKHACAKNVEIKIEMAKHITITICDNGSGIKEKEDGRVGNGMRNMNKRIESIGGNMRVYNEIGVTTVLTIPL